MPGIDIQLAVEKATPKKPILEESDGKVTAGNVHYCKGVTVVRCPRCGTILTRSHHYCWNCGQKLEWEEGK
jgi:uncharacterized OB-fold protein